MFNPFRRKVCGREALIYVMTKSGWMVPVCRGHYLVMILADGFEYGGVVRVERTCQEKGPVREED